MADYIKREDLLELYDLGGLEVENAKVPLNVVIQTIKDMPSADVIEQETKCACVPSVWTDDELPIYALQKRGKWLHKQTTADFHVVGQCSICKERRRIDNFCPNCGAKMESDGKDDK